MNLLKNGILFNNRIVARLSRKTIIEMIGTENNGLKLNVVNPTAFKAMLQKSCTKQIPKAHNESFEMLFESLTGKVILETLKKHFKALVMCFWDLLGT